MTLRRKLAVVAAVYFIEGFPFAIFRDVWPVYFRMQGVSLTAIGWISGLYLAWSLKLLWSPLVGGFGEPRRWIAGAQCAMAAALLGLAALDPTRSDTLLWATLVAFCLASATQDIAIDAYTIGLVDRGEEGPANAVRITAYRVALVAGGGALLFLPRWIGWPATFGAAAAVCAALAASIWTCPRVALGEAGRRPLGPALRSWLGRGGAPGVVGFVLLYRLGDISMAPMLKPFWVDRGYPQEEIGLVSTTLGAAATVAGAVAGGTYIARRGIPRALLVLGVFALVSNLGYAAAAALPEAGRPGIYCAALAESFCGGLASAGFLAFLMRICEREHAAVQYAGLTALYALPGTAAGALSGWAAQSLGYSAYFGLTALLAIPALFLVGATRGWVGDER